MPSLKQALTSTANLTPVSPAVPENKPPATEDSKVKSLLVSPYRRCPLPPSSNSADSLRQFSQGGLVPVFRTQTPPSNLLSGNISTTSTSTVVVTGGESGSGSTSVTNNPPLAMNASVTTPALTPGQVYLATITLAKAFLPIAVTVSAAARVELYGTSIAQTLDQSRGPTTPPANTIQGLISDVTLVPPQLTWYYVNTVGTNQNSTQTTTIYITITNNGTAVTAITASILFVPAES